MTLFLTEAEHEILTQLVKAELDAVKGEIHEAKWQRHAELLERFSVIEGLLTKLDIGPILEAG